MWKWTHRKRTSPINRELEFILRKWHFLCPCIIPYIFCEFIGKKWPRYQVHQIALCFLKRTCWRNCHQHDDMSVSMYPFLLRSVLTHEHNEHSSKNVLFLLTLRRSALIVTPPDDVLKRLSLCAVGVGAGTRLTMIYVGRVPPGSCNASPGFISKRPSLDLAIWRSGVNRGMTMRLKVVRFQCELCVPEKNGVTAAGFRRKWLPRTHKFEIMEVAAATFCMSHWCHTHFYKWTVYAKSFKYFAWRDRLYTYYSLNVYHELVIRN